MPQEIVFANATLALPGEMVSGSIQIKDGMIGAIDTGTRVPPGAIDCDGDIVAPGLIELHTDNLERHMTPRPKVNWPHKPAIIAHDAELAGTGITTVFDAIRVGTIVSDPIVGTDRYARGMANEILAMRDTDALKISHHIHLRAEICSETLVEELDEFGTEDRIGIVSLMDHTPGQRQFRDIAKLADFWLGKRRIEGDDFQDRIQYLKDVQARFGTRHEAAAVAAANRLGATLASHDDTTGEQVETSHRHGVSVAEFPTTEVAAKHCRDRGIDVIMGAPNLVRGASHSGNVSAVSLAERDLLDILSSDYIPAALLLAAVQLGTLWNNMARGIATVTAAPARAVGLRDRGEIALEKRGDLIRFSLTSGTPHLKSVWSVGNRVA